MLRHVFFLTLLLGAAPFAVNGQNAPERPPGAGVSGSTPSAPQPPPPGPKPPPPGGQPPGGGAEPTPPYGAKPAPAQPDGAPAVAVKTEDKLSVLRVNVTNQPWDFLRPWGKRSPYSRRAVGAVLPGRRV